MEIDKKYSLSDDECPVELWCSEVSYDGSTVKKLTNKLNILVSSDCILIFRGYGALTIAGNKMILCVVDMTSSEDPWSTIAKVGIPIEFEMFFKKIKDEVKNSEEDHKGQIYNPYTDRWSWF